MSEELHFKRKTYIIPEQMVGDVENFLEWIGKHVCKDEEVKQLLLDYRMYEEHVHGRTEEK
jgi:hypothetical protein